MKNKKPFNHFWWIIPALVILFFAIFFIFRSFNEECLELRDWLAFVGSYLGFAGSVILGYVAIYQNRKLRDDNEKQHKNAIKPIININYKKLHLLNVVDMREYFHHIKIENNYNILHTNIIPRDIRSLYREFRDLYDKSSDKSISDKEYNKLDTHYISNVSKLSKKYLLLDLYLDNNGNGNAINIELLLNNQKLEITPSLQSNKYNGFLFLIEATSKQNTLTLELKLTYENIDNEVFEKQETICVSRNIDGQFVINDK